MIDEKTWSAITVGEVIGPIQWAKVYDEGVPLPEGKFPVPIPLEHRVYGEVAFKSDNAKALLVLTIGFIDPDGIPKGDIWTPFAMVIPGMEYSATSACVTLDKQGVWVLYATLQEGAEILDSRDWCAIDAGKEGFPWVWLLAGAIAVGAFAVLVKDKKRT